jgi:hypothetical protein
MALFVTSALTFIRVIYDPEGDVEDAGAHKTLRGLWKMQCPHMTHLNPMSQDT